MVPHTAVNEHQLRGSVLLIVGCLLDANLREIPNVDTSVTSSGCENGWVVGRPSHVEDLVGVSLESMQSLAEVS